MKYVLAAALLVSLPVGVSAQAPQGLLEARDQMNAAGAKGDKAAYGKFLSEDFTWVDRAGRLRNKAAMVEEVAPATGTPPATAAPEIRGYGNAAVLVATRRNPDGIQVNYIQAWVKNASGWQVVAHQAVPASADQPGSPATKASSTLPANMGSQVERDAVQKNHDTVGEANRTADVKMFAGAVTDQFVAVGPNGLSSKQQRIEQITKAGPQAGLGTTPGQESSTRIHGNMAVRTQRGKRPQNVEVWTTTVSIKEAGQWRRAATITTPITGAARPKTH